MENQLSGEVVGRFKLVGLMMILFVAGGCQPVVSRSVLTMLYSSSFLLAVAGCEQACQVRLSGPWAMKNLPIELKLQNPFGERATLIGFRISCSCLDVQAPKYSFNASESKKCQLYVDATKIPTQVADGGEVKIFPVFETQEHRPTKVAGQAFIVKFGPMRSPVEIQPRIVSIPTKSTSARFTVQVLCPHTLLSFNSPESVRVSCISSNRRDGTTVHDCKVISKDGTLLSQGGDFTVEAVITNHQQSSASGQIEFTEAHPTEAILTGEIARPTELGGKVFLILKVSDQSLPKAVHVARIDATIGEERIDSMSLSESAADQLIFRFPLEHPPTPGNHGFFANVLFYSSEFRDGSVLVAKRRCLFCQSPKGESK